MNTGNSRQLVGHCTECGKPIHVGDNAGTIPSPTAKYGIDFICEGCATSQGAVFLDVSSAVLH